MNSSIWKTPDQKPDTDQHVLFFAGGGIFPYLGFYYPKFDTFNDWKSKDVQRWASVFEVIAQADKAERLQKQLIIAKSTLEYLGYEFPPAYPEKNVIAEMRQKARNAVKYIEHKE